MFVVKYRKIFFALSTLLTAGAIVIMLVYGFNFGIDFKGGALLEVSYPAGARPTLEMVQGKIDTLGLGGYSVRPSGDNLFVVRTRELNPTEKTTLLSALSYDSVDGKTQVANLPREERSNSIGPVVGNELKNKAFVAIAVVILAIVLFVTFAFRKVSKPVSSWKYGLVTVLALVHDVIVPTGVFILFTHFYSGEIDLLFVTAILAILGYSVHDTIVVFDRVRENLRINSDTRANEDFEITVGKSVSQTFGRSINTSLTIFLVLVVLYFIGGETTRNFAFVLLVGVIVGTYSSIFLASPLLVTLGKMKGKGTEK
ncbi:protein translocase subunit SecF [Candidatus Parcubacteria bacterium]|nr:protein translocase subunit SecF [Candidatus Parcubacteria bacterium]